MSTITLPKVLANFQTSLAASMSAAATSLTLDSSTTPEGATLSGSYVLTIDEGTSSEEHMIVTQTGASGAVTRRGLSKDDMWTEVTGNKQIHNRGAVVKITNVSLVLLNRLLNGDDTFNSVNWTGVNSIDGLATPTAGETTKAANVAYVNAVSIAGASDANTTTKGIVETPTAAELTSGASTGGTGANLAPTPAQIATQIQSGSWLYFVEDGTGTDDTYTATITPALTAYTAGQLFVGKLTIANTANASLNINGLGAKTIRKYAGGSKLSLETGDILANQHCLFCYDGTEMVMLNPSAGTVKTAEAEAVNLYILSLTGLGDASSLHYHEAYEQVKNQLRRATYPTFTGGIDDGLSSNVTASGTLTRTLLNSLFTVTAAGADAELANSGSGIFCDDVSASSGITYLTWADSPQIKFICDLQFSHNTSQDVFFGFSAGVLGAAYSNATTTSNHAAFMIDDGTIYASVANGTTQTRTDISSGITLTDHNVFEIDATFGTNVKFYINGTLKATISTNLPTSANEIYFDIVMTGTAASNRYMALKHPFAISLVSGF